MPWKVKAMLSAFGVGASIMMGAAARADFVEVRIINMTRGQAFTPVLLWSHGFKLPRVVELGKPASDELKSFAEEGDTEPLREQLLAIEQERINGIIRDVRRVRDIADIPSIAPGEEVSRILDEGPRGRHVSLIARVENTNDGFIVLQGVEIPGRLERTTREFLVPALDAGTEENNELCAFIESEFCGLSNAHAPAPERGPFTHTGIKGIGDLEPATFDWKNPVAKVIVGRVARRF